MKTWTKAGLAAAAMLMAPWIAAAPVEVSEVEIIKKGFSLNRATNTFDTLVTVKNTGSQPLAPPFRLVVDSVRPVSVSLYNQYGTTEQGEPYVEVDLPGYVLQPGQSTQVPVRFVNLGGAVTQADFKVIAQPLSAQNSADITVTAKWTEEAGGQAVGEGYLVKVDGATRAVTDQDGKAQIKVPTDAQVVSVQYAPNRFGYADLPTLSAGASALVEVRVSDSGELSEESQLRMDRLQHLMIPRDLGQVVLRFFQNEVQVRADLIEIVELRDPAGGKTKDITELFSIKPDGSIAASGNTFFNAVGSIAGKKLLFAQVLDSAGKTHFQEIPFYISQFKTQGRLTAPPSNPGLDLSGIPVEISVLNTDIAFLSETTADGSFPLPMLPAGNILVKATLQSGGTPYIASGLAVISGNVRVAVTLRGPEDIANNVAPVTTSPL